MHSGPAGADAHNLGGMVTKHVHNICLSSSPDAACPIRIDTVAAFRKTETKVKSKHTETQPFVVLSSNAMKNLLQTQNLRIPSPLAAQARRSLQTAKYTSPTFFGNSSTKIISP